jgi:hypothetical protein
MIEQFQIATQKDHLHVYVDEINTTNLKVNEQFLELVFEID